LFKVSGICGSPRAKGNTEILLDTALNKFDEAFFKTEKIPLREYILKPCLSYGYCIENGKCCIEDDVTNIMIPRLFRISCTAFWSILR